MQTEMRHRGYRIVQVDKPKHADTFTSHGFEMAQAFEVLDDYDDPILPVPQYFWSPRDAIAAIEMVDTVFPDRKGSKWPTTAAHEYSLMQAYRRQFWFVFHVLKTVMPRILRDAKQWDENPTAQLESELVKLHTNVYQERRRPDAT